MCADFHRTFVNDRSFIRGAARILIAPYNQPRPLKIDDVITLATGGVSEVQSATITGAPTGGTFTLSYSGQTTSGIAFNAAGAAVQTALEALGTIGVGNVTVTGATGGPYTITFIGALAEQDVAQITGSGTGLTGGTSPNITTATTTAGTGQYDAKPGWTDLGATKTGIQISINNAEESFDVDQILGDISSAPTSWECSVGTALAEMTPERLQVAWEGSAITLDATPTTGSEQEVGFGSPTSYVKRRVAVLFQRPNGLIRAYLFHQVQRTPQESAVTHAKTGEQISVPVRFKVLSETSITDPYKRFFVIRDQAVS